MYHIIYKFLQTLISNSLKSHYLSFNINNIIIFSSSPKSPSNNFLNPKHTLREWYWLNGYDLKRLKFIKTRKDWFENIVCIIWMCSFKRKNIILHNVVYVLSTNLKDTVILTIKFKLRKWSLGGKSWIKFLVYKINIK